VKEYLVLQFKKGEHPTVSVLNIWFSKASRSGRLASKSLATLGLGFAVLIVRRWLRPAVKLLFTFGCALAQQNLQA